MGVSWSVQTFDVLDSTQEFLKSEISGLEEGVCIRALSQKSGHGRHGRDWRSPKGNLYFSFLLKPYCDPQKFGEIALVAGLAVAETLQPYTDVTLKWPNDVLIDGQKVCGILVEAIDGALIVGVGINVHHAPIDNAVSLCAYDLDAESVMHDFLGCFDTLYGRWQQSEFEAIRQQWLDYSFDVGTIMSVKIAENKISGAYQGLDSSGFLLLLCDKSNKIKTITSGDVFS